MPNQKGKVALASSMMALALLAGCQQGTNVSNEPSKPPVEMLKEGAANLTAVNSDKFDIALMADIKDPVSGNVKFDARLEGSADKKDLADPKLNLKFNGNFDSGAGQGGSAQLEVRMDKTNLFFNAMKLDVKGETLPPEVVTYLNKWWKIAIPAGTLEQMKAEMPSDAMMQSQEAEMKKAIAESNFISDAKFVGLEDVKGEKSYHYTANLDKKAFLAFIQKVSAEQGQTISAEEMKQAEADMEKVDMKFDGWVNASTNTLNKVKVELNAKSTSASEASGVMSLEATIYDVNKPVTIEAPANATDFPVEQFMMPIMMMMQGAGAMPTDPSMMDPNSALLDSGDLTGTQAMGQ